MGNGRSAYKIVSGNVKYYIYGDDEAIKNVDDNRTNTKLSDFYCNVETKHFQYGSGAQIPYNTQEGSERPTQSCIIGHPYITNVESDYYQYTKGGFVYRLNRDEHKHMTVIQGGGKDSDPKYNTWKCVGNKIEITLFYKSGNLMGTNILEGEATGKSEISQQGGDNDSNTAGGNKQKSKSSTVKKIENKPTQSTYVSTEVGP